MTTPGYWPSPWPGEDGGPARLQRTNGAFATGPLHVRFREAVATTMIVLREPGEVFALCHTAGPDAVSWVERIDPESLEWTARSPKLAGGPTWPGGVAAHANGSLYVVFGNHAHRLDVDCNVVASRTLPRLRPYNSFVILPDGHLVTKDFGGVLPGEDPAAHVDETAELIVLEPVELEIVARAMLPQASIARLSADGAVVYAVGTSALFRAEWNGGSLALDRTFAPRYITMHGQSYGWDPVLALGAAWFLDNGRGSERYAGSFRGQGTNTAPLHLVRVDLATGVTTLAEICALTNGVIANPPLVDIERRIVVGYDSGNGVVTAFDVDECELRQRWTRLQNHACHALLFADDGVLVMTHHDGTRMMDEIVVLNVETGDELQRVDSGSAVQSVLFPAPGWHDDVYYCSFAGIARAWT